MSYNIIINFYIKMFIERYKFPTTFFKKITNFYNHRLTIYSCYISSVSEQTKVYKTNS